MSKHIALAKKLKALAEKGVGGEKINAEKMLEVLMKKHGITIEEIEEEKLEDHYFKIEKVDFYLWYQIVKHVNYSIKCYGEFPKKIIRELALGGNHMVSCTASEYIEIEAKYSFYRKLYYEELEVFKGAFYKANDLLVNNPNREDRDFTMEEYEKWKRVNDMAGKIKSESFRRQIQKQN